MFQSVNTTASSGPGEKPKQDHVVLATIPSFEKKPQNLTTSGRVKLVLFVISSAALAAFLSFRHPIKQASIPRIPTDPYGVARRHWDCLNATVGGRLGRGIPFARRCFSTVGPLVAHGGASCESVQENYHSNPFRASQFGSAMRTQWETCQTLDEGCLLDSNNPTNVSAFEPPKTCYQGSVAPYYIAVQDQSDVVAAFNFSQRTGVPLSIKNSGHDFAGRSIVRGTLAIWTQNVKYVNYSSSFVPEGCNSSPGIPAFTYGAGEDMQSLIAFADTHNVTFIGGSSPTVGAAGGWLQGGGHSSLSNRYGLGVDRVLQFRVVTPDGVLRVANECQNTDLFWALRGGGGGTFGVVMEATSEVVPKLVPTVSISWNMSYNPTTSRALMEVLVENAVQWSKDGWGGYAGLLNGGILANPTLNTTQAQSSLKPLTDFLSSNNKTFTWASYPSFSDLFAAILKLPDAGGDNNALASRLVPDTLFEPDQAPALLDAITEVAQRSNGIISFFFTTPYSYSATAGATSVTPAWRSAVWHVISSAVWPWDASQDTAQAQYAKLHHSMKPLRALTPGGGAYQNEADVYEPHAPLSFWGSNYPRLVQIKKKYDPNGLLDCWRCVGWKGKEYQTSLCYFDLE